jgi:enamine deaminase RidA (YjgF/YER057c/UK114 family)
MSDVDARLKELGLELPEPVAPVANYVPFVRSGDLVHVSGQIAKGPDGLVTGVLGQNLDVAGGQAAARYCALNLIAQFKIACDGDLDRVRRVVKLGGFVAADRSFTDVPQVINGASDLIGQVFGEKGRHARSAVGVAALPLGTAVEIDAVIEIG